MKMSLEMIVNKTSISCFEDLTQLSLRWPWLMTEERERELELLSVSVSFRKIDTNLNSLEDSGNSVKIYSFNLLDSSSTFFTLRNHVNFCCPSNHLENCYFPPLLPLIHFFFHLLIQSSSLSYYLYSSFLFLVNFLELESVIL